VLSRIHPYTSSTSDTTIPRPPLPTSPLTVSTALMAAPAPSSCRATSLCPSWAAWCSEVQPFCSSSPGGGGQAPRQAHTTVGHVLPKALNYSDVMCCPKS
jgi:hypothetical protein